MNVSRLRLKRAAVMAGFVGAAVVAGLVVVPATASAAVGKQPGNLTFTPATGPMASNPQWNTTTACTNGAFTNSAKLFIVKDDGTQSAVSVVVTPVTAPFSGKLQANLSTIASVDHMVVGHTYEFVVNCQDPNGNNDPEQSSFLTVNADGTYSTSATPPPPPAGVATTTTLGTPNPATQTQGGAVSLTATVAAADTAGNDAVGSVEFDSAGAALGTVAVSGGTATLSVSTLPVGTDSVTAKFIPTDPTAFSASTSAPQTVTITSAPPPAGAETLNVNLGAVTNGTLTLQVDNGTPVTISQPTNAGTDLEGKGTLNNVTVIDSRTPSQPGWDLSGAVSDFTSGTNSFSGNALGWSPKIVTPNAAKDVTAGGQVASNNPGLKTPASLASAAAGKGGGTTVLAADLDLHVAFTQPAGNYTATETNTLVSK